MKLSLNIAIVHGIFCLKELVWISIFCSPCSSPVDRKDDRRGGRGGDRQDRGRGRSGGPGTSGQTKGSSRRAPPERRIFVSNIPFEMKWQEIKDMFR